MAQEINHSLSERKRQQKKSFAVLIDPDKVDPGSLDRLIVQAVDAKVDYLFIGGSLVVSHFLDVADQQVKSKCDIPVVLFPGSPSQVSRYADALLYL